MVQRKTPYLRTCLGLPFTAPPLPLLLPPPPLLISGAAAAGSSARSLKVFAGGTVQAQQPRRIPVAPILFPATQGMASDALGTAALQLLARLATQGVEEASAFLQQHPAAVAGDAAAPVRPALGWRGGRRAMLLEDHSLSSGATAVYIIVSVRRHRSLHAVVHAGHAKITVHGAAI